MDISVLLAGILPKEKLIDLLYDEIMSYRCKPNYESFNKVAATCSLIITKASMKTDDFEGMMGLANKLEEIKTNNEILSPKNPS